MFTKLPITLFMTTHEKHTYNIQNATFKYKKQNLLIEKIKY